MLQSGMMWKRIPWKIWLLYNNYDYSLYIRIRIMNHYSWLNIIRYSYNNSKQFFFIFILHHSSSVFLSLRATKLRTYPLAILPTFSPFLKPKCPKNSPPLPSVSSHRIDFPMVSFTNLFFSEWLTRRCRLGDFRIVAWARYCLTSGASCRVVQLDLA